jgi:hypothetical protein
MIKHHCLLINLTNGSTLTPNNQVTKETINSVDSTLENLVNWSNPLVSTCLYNYFNKITTPCSTIDVSISVINS